MSYEYRLGRQEGSSYKPQVGDLIGEGAEVKAYEIDGGEGVGLVVPSIGMERQFLERRWWAILEVKRACNQVDLENLKQAGLLEHLNMVRTPHVWGVHRVHGHPLYGRDMLAMEKAPGVTLDVWQASDYRRGQLGQLIEQFQVARLSLGDRLGIAAAILLVEENLISRGRTMLDIKPSMARVDLTRGWVTIIDPGVSWVGDERFKDMVRRDSPAMDYPGIPTAAELWEMHTGGPVLNTGSELARLVTMGVERQEVLADLVKGIVNDAESPGEAVENLKAVFNLQEFQEFKTWFGLRRMHAEVDKAVKLLEIAEVLGFKPKGEKIDFWGRGVDEMQRLFGKRYLAEMQTR